MYTNTATAMSSINLPRDRKLASLELRQARSDRGHRRKSERTGPAVRHRLGIIDSYQNLEKPTNKPTSVRSSFS